MTDRVRFSTLKHFAQSPAHFRYWQSHEMKATPAMQIGTAVHARILGGPPVVCYDGTRRGKEWDAFRAYNRPDATILSTAEHATVEAICSATFMHRPACEVLFDRQLAINEGLIEWTFNGVPFRSTPDRVFGPFNGATLVELKTTRDASPRGFLRDAERRHYHAQLGTYRAALAHDGVRVSRVVIVACETVPPYSVAVYELSERALDIGYRLACGWLEQYKVCRDADEWPGYSQSAMEWDILPPDELDFSGLDEMEANDE